MSFPLLASVLHVFLSCKGPVRKKGVPFIDGLGTTREKVWASGTWDDVEAFTIQLVLFYCGMSTLAVR